MKGDLHRNHYSSPEDGRKKDNNVGHHWREKETIEKKSRMCSKTYTNCKKSANTNL